MTYPSQRVQDVLKAHYIRVKLDVEEDHDAAPLMMPAAIPVAIVFDSKGNELRRTVGFVGAEAYAQWLEDARR